MMVIMKAFTITVDFWQNDEHEQRHHGSHMLQLDGTTTCCKATWFARRASADNTNTSKHNIISVTVGVQGQLPSSVVRLRERDTQRLEDTAGRATSG
jgi:hypothetical protein